MGVEVLVSRLEKVREQRPSGGCQKQWMAACPAHDDGDPSLAVAIGRDGAPLMFCHALCTPEEILDAVGLRWADIRDEFYDNKPWYFKHQTANTAEEQKRLTWPGSRKHLKPKPLIQNDAAWLLAVFDDKRKQGQKLSKADRQAEREAFITLQKR